MKSTQQFYPRLGIFLAVMAVALAWALTTSHVWEDFYITYRSSKNLATGHGLVFTRGDHLHTFTSPLGVLLPAAASWLTGNSSDPAAIWIFRVWSAAALAGAVLLVLAIARRHHYGGLAAVVLAAAIALDGKSVDFTTNGMETGFLLLFIAYTLWAMFACEGRRWLHLGLAWGGMMWTRPDGFLYIGLLGAGAFFFNDPRRTGLTRGQWLKLYLQAGAVCTVIYLPWIEWSWWYYGTPIPHTITAKGGVSGGDKSVLGALKTLASFPVSVWKGSTSLEGTFLPSYYQMGGWPHAVVMATRGLALLLAFQWVLPWWRAEIRAASFAFCGLHLYLTYFPFFPFPWYLPGTTILAAFTLGGMLAQGWETAGRRPAWRIRLGGSRGLKAGLIVIALAFVGTEGWLTWQMRREMALEQIYSATGTRRKVGEWLKANARAGDTVFMEPLGHIGYFSGLKTYDFPGLSSREVVRAIRAVGTDWADLIDYLAPDWVVLRPPEYARLKQSVPWLLGEEQTYQLVQEINNRPQIERHDVYGRNYVEFDAHLLIFHRQYPRFPEGDALDTATGASRGFTPVKLGGQPLYESHGSRIVRVKVPANAKHLWIIYGMPPDSYRGPAAANEDEFRLEWFDGRKSERLMTHLLQPRTRPDDRGLKIFETKLPRHDGGAELILRTIARPPEAIWSCWGRPEFAP